MSKYFDSFEEISAAYPIDTEHNQSFLVRIVYQHVFSWRDIDLIKERHPGGWLDKEGHRYYYYDNRCDDFLWSMMFLLIRDKMKANNCCFVDRYVRRNPV